MPTTADNKSPDRIALCSWSLRPANPTELAARILETGILQVQLALNPLRENPGAWNNVESQLRQAGIRIVSGMCGCVGEDYSTLDSIRRTGGLWPNATWEQNRRNFQAAAALARRLGLKLVTFHAGFIPENPSDAGYGKMVERLRIVADLFGANGIEVGLETGQETAAALGNFLELLARPNVGANFDPANMILYGHDDPATSVRLLAERIRQVHIKDALRTKVAGTWGTEVPVGTGDVDWRAFFQALGQAGYSGNFIIERESGDQRTADIRRAKSVTESHLAR